jgi:hypothetical protein
VIKMDANEHGGIFAQLIGVAAFFHRISFGVEAIRRQRPGSNVSTQASLPIGGERQAYARAIHGTYLPTGNAFELRYGANRMFPNLPSMSLRFRSIVCPVTVHEVASVAYEILRAGFQMWPSYLETTFDIPNVGISELRNQLVTATRRERELEDGFGKRTFYAGSPRSPYQIRLYDARGVCRVELTLRSAYFRQHQMRSIGDIARIRQMDISKFLRFATLRPASLLAADMRGMPAGKCKNLLLDWPRNRPLRIWASALRFHGFDPHRHLMDSDWQARIEAMQRRLIW